MALFPATVESKVADKSQFILKYYWKHQFQILSARKRLEFELIYTHV